MYVCKYLFNKSVLARSGRLGAFGRKGWLGGLKPSRKWGSEPLGPPKGRYGRHLRRCGALLGPAALHMDLLAAFWAPFWDPPDPNNGLQDATEVVQRPPKRFKSGQKSLRGRFGRHLRRSGALLRPASLHMNVLEPSRPQHLCSRRGQSIEFRKPAFPPWHEALLKQIKNASCSVLPNAVRFLL